MIIEKSRVLEILRGRGQHNRAEWVDRTLPDDIDTDHNAGILATLNLGPRELADLAGASAPARDEATVADPDTVAGA